MSQFVRLCFGTVLLVGGGLVSWFAQHQSDSAYLSWIGLLLMIGAGAFGMTALCVCFAIVLPMVQCFDWIREIMCNFLARAGDQAIAVQYGLALWESLPVIAAVVAGLYLIRQKTSVWSLFIIPTGIFVGIETWLFRPYNFSFGANFVTQVPSAIWLLGTGLVGGLAISWCFVIWEILSNKKTYRDIAIGLLAPIAIVGIGELLFADYTSKILATPKNEHDVIALQGGTPPFASGFDVMYERALYPMILFSGFLPDLILFPENMVQASSQTDINDDEGNLKRQTTAIGMCMTVPHAQVLFGVRDFNHSRLYWSEKKAGDIPEVKFSEIQDRVIGVDYIPTWLPRALRGLSWMGDTGPQIRPQQTQAMIRLQAKNSEKLMEPKVIGRAIPLFSGEIRKPRTFLKIRKDASITVVVNPSISGWLGSSEAKVASVQARARLTELGLLGYRVGQQSGTEYIAPWRNSVLSTKDLGNGSLRFTALIPTFRLQTGYTAVFWIVSYYLLPLIAIGLLVQTVLQRRRRLSSGF
jgi:hypothetical protein